MALDKDISYVYEQILKKVHYDETIQKYVISKEDYIPLNLTNKQLNILRKMCKYSGVELENYEYTLPSVEDEALFREYNELKAKIEKDPDNQELEERRITIRNKIVTDNLELVRAIIDRNIESLQEIPNKEDLYQLGYEILFDYVEGRDIIYPKDFTKYISSKLTSDIRTNITFLDKGLTEPAHKDLKKILKARNILSSINPYPTQKELARKSELEQRRVEDLLNLERLLDTISIDEAIDTINNNEENDNSPLYDDTFEKQLLLSTVREMIIKIIYTLPQRQRDVIMLSYGFKDGICYNDVEISRILSVTNMRIGTIRQQAIENLRLSLRSKYLRELYDLEYIHQETSLTKKQSYILEEILIDYIPEEELDEYLKQLSEAERNILNLYHGFETGTKLNLTEVSKAVGLTPSRTYTIKKQAYEKIKNQIIEQQFEDNKEQITDEEYFDYLMKTYVIHKKLKNR